MSARRIGRTLTACAWVAACQGSSPPDHVVVVAPSPPDIQSTSAPVAAPTDPLDPRASCLAPLPEHTEPSPCPASAEATACRFAEGNDYFQRRDYPAAAERFITLSLEHAGQLGRASAENAQTATRCIDFTSTCRRAWCCATSSNRTRETNRRRPQRCSSCSRATARRRAR